MQKQVQVGEVTRQKQFLVSQEVEDVPEHAPVPVDEVMLFQSIQYDRNRSVEHLAEARVRVTVNKIQKYFCIL